MNSLKRMIPVISICFLFGVILLSLIFYSLQELDDTTNKLIISRKIVESSFDLNYLTSDYLVNPTKRIKFQWEITYAKFKKQLAQLAEKQLGLYSQKLVKRINNESQAAKHYFSLISSPAGGAPADEARRTDFGRIISVDLHQMVSAVFSLENIFKREFLNTQKKISFWFLAIIALFFAIFIWFIYRLFQEINRRQASQEKLIKANQRLQLVDRLVEFTGDGVYRYSYQEDRILFLNQGFVDILGLDCPPRELIGKRLEEVLICTSECKEVRGIVEKEGSVRNYIYHFKTLSGEDKWALYNSFLVKDSKGREIVETIMSDITDKRKTEQKNEFLAGVLDSASLSVIATDKERKIIYANPASEKLYGYKPGELLGKDPLIFNAEPQAEGIENEIMKQARAGKVYRRRLLNKNKQGERFAVETSVYQLTDKEGEFVALVGFQKNINQEIKAQEKIKQSEAKFRTIFESTANGVFIADVKTGNIIDCNSAAAGLIGLPKEEIIGMHQSGLHPEGEQAKYKEFFSRHIASGSIHNQEAEVNNRIKGVIPVWISAKTIKLGGKEVILGIFVDISDQKKIMEKETELVRASAKAEVEHTKAKELTKAYNQLKKMQDKLVKTEKLAVLGKLSGIVAHDLRNPLAVIRNSIYILKKSLVKSADVKVKRYLRILDEEIEAADSIIEDILSFTRLKNIRLTTFDINGAIENILAKINIPSGIKLIKKLDSGIPKVKGDKELLQRVFINLINNAIEAMPEGGSLTIKGAADNGFFTAQIIDTGFGISKKDQANIFEPMFSTKVHGTGLGLSACKNIIDAHKGSIRAQSRKGKGAKMTLKVPFLPPENGKKPRE